MTKLYECQEKHARRIVRWLAKSREPFYGLKGYAGTGKTHIVKWLVESLIGRMKVVLCAPSNKAVNVLSELGTGAPCCTIYSLLGLTMREQEDRLVLEKTDGSKDTKYHLVILDECGQVNEQLIQYIKQSSTRGVRYLFVGDDKQWNPVGEARSLVWNMCEFTKMTTVVRHDNQILRLATKARKTRLRDLVIKNRNDGHEGVWYLDDDDFYKTLRESAAKGLFGDKCCAYAWRNSAVDALNRVIRVARFGEAAYSNIFLPEDRITFTGPHETDSGLRIYTDLEASVVNVAEGAHPMYADVKCMYVAAKFGHAGTHTFRTVADNATFSALLSGIAHDARTRDKALWKKFWAVKNSVACVKHGYAYTTHRAQGSTVHTAFVDAADIMCNRDYREAQRGFYVAVTRPTTRLFIR